MNKQHKFHSFTSNGHTGRLNFLGSELHGPKGTTIVLDWEDLYTLAEAIGTRPPQRGSHFKPQVTGTNTPSDGAWTAVPAHPAHHRHKQEGS